ncbi:hypothetical protein BT69DRAFT_1263324 [Atractiella rhizophila]|nr:hypothetical protein BT69DRAFT_1263324 [Atractiella rhizophila]
MVSGTLKDLSRLWDQNNFDEKGFMIGVAQKEHVVVRRRREVGDIQYVQDGNREWITVIECVSVEGQSSSPYIILAGHNFMSSWVDNPVPGATYSNTPSGWTDEKEGVAWLTIWEEETQPLDPEEWQLLVMDGHGSHQMIEFLEYAPAHNVLAFCTIPHSRLRNCCHRLLAKHRPDSPQVFLCR